MFTYNVRGENIEITDAIRNYVIDKVSKLEKYFENDATVHANCRTYRDGDAKAEITVSWPRLTVRAEDKSDDLYKSIDAAVEKLERQVRKYKTRLNRKSRELDTEAAAQEAAVGQPAAEEEQEDIKIVRVKDIEAKPMTAEEAVLQMELTDHDFYIFVNAESEAISVVYKRKSGHYGLIEISQEAQ